MKIFHSSLYGHTTKFPGSSLPQVGVVAVIGNSKAMGSLSNYSVLAPVCSILGARLYTISFSTNVKASSSISLTQPFCW